MRQSQIKRIASYLYIIILFIFMILLSVMVGRGISDLGLDPSLFVPAFTAVIGSFVLYFIRQYRLRSRVETAIKTELEQMDTLESLSEDFDSITNPPPNEDLSPEIAPTPESLPTSVYESSTSQLSLLPAWIYADVVDFYTHLLRHKPTLRAIHDDDMDPIMANQEDLYKDVGDLEEKRQKLLTQLK